MTASSETTTPAAEAPRPWSRSALWAWAATSAALVALLYYRVGVAFWPRWASEEAYQHCILVPLIVGGLIWFRRGRLRELRPAPSYLGLGLLAAGLLLAYLGYLTGARFLVGLSFPVVLLGLVAAALGPAYLPSVGFPLALFIFAVPFPKHVLGMISMPMQLISSHLTASCTRLMGIPVLHEGVNIALPSFQFRVAEECSGMNSLLALILAGAVIVELMGLRLWQKLIVYVLIPLVVLVANVIRLMSVVLLGEMIGPEFALNHMVHGGSDVVVYAAAFALIWGLSSWLKRFSPRAEEEPQPAPA